MLCNCLECGLPSFAEVAPNLIGGCYVIGVLGGGCSPGGVGGFPHLRRYALGGVGSA